MNKITKWLSLTYIISQLAFKLANCEITWIKSRLIKWFIGFYKVNMQEAAEENPEKYPDFDDFFVRALKPELRPIASDPQAIVAPVDGMVMQCGKITAGTLIQAKGKTFSVINLIGGEGKNFMDGDFMTFYLAPQDYHRVHIPYTGILEHMRIFPGKLFSVQPKNLEKIAELYTRNERVVNLFATNFGTMAVVLVGAMIVGGIEMQWEGVVARGGYGSDKTDYHYHGREIEVTKGSEIGQFKFGSTVIVLFPKGKVKLGVASNTAVKMGQVVAKVV